MVIDKGLQPLCRLRANGVGVGIRRLMNRPSLLIASICLVMSVVLR